MLAAPAVSAVLPLHILLHINSRRCQLLLLSATLCYVMFDDTTPYPVHHRYIYIYILCVRRHTGPVTVPVTVMKSTNYYPHRLLACIALSVVTKRSRGKGKVKI